MTSGFGPKSPGLMPDSTKYPLNVCGVHGSKIHGSKSSVTGIYQFTMGVVFRELFTPLQ